MTQGSDFRGAADLDRGMGTVDGPRAVAESIIRRLRTKRGTLLDFPAYGHDLRQYIGSSAPEDRIASAVEDQCYQEETVEQAIVSVSKTETVIRVSIRILTPEGPFEFTLSVDELTASVIFPGV